MSDTPTTYKPIATMITCREDDEDAMVTIREYRELERENAALKADKERLDWLLMQSCWLLHNYDWNEKITSREDIDAARKEETK